MNYENFNIEVKEIQKIQVEMLLEIKNFCQQNQIKYQLFAGTLLGTIRHEGFIPWDDDIDICMLRKDYNRFLQIWKNNSISDLFLQTNNTDKNYIMQFAKIRKNNTLFVENSLSDLEIHHGVFIDIFPMDNVEPFTILGSFQQKALHFIGRMNLLRIKKLCLHTDNHIEKILRIFGHYFMNLIPKNWTNRLYITIACWFYNKETYFVSHLTNGTNRKKYMNFLIKREDFEDSIERKFEGHYFPIARNYHSILTRIYGDFMHLPPLEQQKPHHKITIIELNHKIH